MPTIDQNHALWNQDYDWRRLGDEWSRAYGGAESQWFGTILPRLHTYVPTGTIVEIAPGFGRWTHFLKDLCTRLEVVDLSEKCIRACQERFAGESHIGYHVNDGRSLAMIEDASVDLLFSYDSLVHVEADVLDAYIMQIAAKLRPDGVAFLHHSNLGAYPGLVRIERGWPRLFRVLRRLRLATSTHWRGADVSSATVQACATASGLACLAQERINISETRRLYDCISVFARPESKWAHPTEVRDNPGFVAEIHAAAALARLHARPAVADSDDG